mgnify:CR=1 FL=1
MRILVTMAGVYGAARLLDIESAHIDGCLYHGYSGLEFAERLVRGGGRGGAAPPPTPGGGGVLLPGSFSGTPRGSCFLSIRHAPGGGKWRSRGAPGG